MQITLKSELVLFMLHYLNTIQYFYLLLTKLVLQLTLNKLIKSKLGFDLYAIY